VHCLRKGQLRLIGRLLYRNGIFQILFDFEDKAIRHGKGKLLAEAAGNGAPGGQRNDTHRQILALPKGIAGQCAVLPLISFTYTAFQPLRIPQAYALLLPLLLGVRVVQRLAFLPVKNHIPHAFFHALFGSRRSTVQFGYGAALPCEKIPQQHHTGEKLFVPVGLDGAERPGQNGLFVNFVQQHRIYGILCFGQHWFFPVSLYQQRAAECVPKNRCIIPQTLAAVPRCQVAVCAAYPKGRVHQRHQLLHPDSARCRFLLLRFHCPIPPVFFRSFWLHLTVSILAHSHKLCQQKGTGNLKIQKKSRN